MIDQTSHREQLLAELVDVSARVDALVIESRRSGGSDNSAELEALRARQRELTEQLDAVQKPGHEKWENIGHGD